MRITFIALFIAAVLTFTACGNDGNNQTSGHVNSNASEDLTDAVTIKPSFASTDAKLEQQVQQIYNAYLHLQSALVRDKTSEASSAATNMGQIIKTFDAANTPPDQKQAYDTYASEIQELTTSIGNSKDINGQRNSFSPLSDHVFELIKTFGNIQPVYQTHCPMAFDGKGASWLSDKTEIRNPYFGDQMLECGEVINIIRK